MANRNPKTGGYNSRSRREHPGVRLVRKGAGFVIRYQWPGSTKWIQETVRDSSGTVIGSKERARPFAVKKSDELATERAHLTVGRRALDVAIDWQRLYDEHQLNLDAEARASKTKRDYRYAWEQFAAWPGLPRAPRLLTIHDLRNYVGYMRGLRDKAGNARLSAQSVATHARHIKAILNYGRRFLSCIKLDGESVGLGLRIDRLPKPKPVALSSQELRAILAAALDNDRDYPHTPMFPFLAFLMIVGCRRGDAERFRFGRAKSRDNFSWIDFDGAMIHVFAQKLQRELVVPLAPRSQLRAMLERMRAAVDPLKEPYLFGGHAPLAIADRRAGAGDSKAMGRSGKYALERIIEDSGVSFSCKDLRSTLATYMANSQLGSNLYTLAGELGHHYDVLVKHYAKHMQLPAAQRDATDVSDLLGIRAEMDAWLHLGA